MSISPRVSASLDIGVALGESPVHGDRLEIGTLEQDAKYRAPDVREHIVRRTVIALDQAAHFHDLHCAREDPDGRVIDVHRGAKQDHALARREAVSDVFRYR